MRLFIEKFFRKVYSGYLYPHSKISYSQNGEDLIIRDLLYKIGILKPTYLDIGANEPRRISNTYLLYTKGSSGVLIEPNPFLYKKLTKIRTRDKCINAGVAFDEKREADFYLFPNSVNGLSTFSKEEAEFWEKTGNEQIGRHKFQSIIKMKLVDINDVISQYLSPHPNVVSIDVEGLDLQILKRLDFQKHKPEVFCVETLSYEADNKEIKNKSLIEFLESKGYFCYADTYINSIFCRKDSYKR